jgi:hypothetical protein
MDETNLDFLEKELRDKDQKINDLNTAIGSNIYNQAQDNNLIVFQLELDNILERIEHLLRGDIVSEDKEGNIKFKKPENKDLIVLNEYGVQLILNIISFYLNRNTVLSNYHPDRVFEILYDLGIELADLIWESYEKMGLTTSYKRARYVMIVMNILHTLESAYNRALTGGERESLRSARIVTQTQPLGQQGMMAIQQPQKKWYKPWTY